MKDKQSGQTSNLVFEDNQFQEPYLYSVNRDTFKKNHATDVFNKYLRKRFTKGEGFFLISGSDSGLLIPYLMSQDFNSDNRYLLVESDELAPLLQERYQRQLANDHIRICTLSEWMTAAQEMEVEAFIYNNNFHFVRSLAAVDLADLTYHHLNQSLRSEVEVLKFRINSSLGNHSFIKRQLENISENYLPANLLSDKFTGHTAVILAGGPSLDEHIEWVKAHKDHLLIIAVSRISKRLINAGLMPHIVVSVDPQDVSFEVSKEMLNFNQDTLFIHTNNCQSGLVSQWPHKKLYLSQRLPWTSELNEENFSGSGPTVTNTAYTIAVNMGVENILLVGVDLCFTQQGVSHASGSVEADVTGEKLAFIGEWVSTYQGYLTQTPLQYAQAAEMINIQAKQSKEKGVNTYNLSANAINLDHITYVAPEALSFDGSGHDFSTLITNEIPEVTANNFQQYQKSLKKEFSKVLKQLREIKQLAQKALEHNKALYKDKGNESDNFAHKIKMDKIESKLNTRFESISTFVKKFGIKHFIKCIQPSNTDDWENEKLEEIGELYYQAFIKSCEPLITLIAAAEQRIIAREQEYKIKGDIQSFTKQWQDDNQPGRTFQWQRIMSERFAQLSSDQKLIITTFEGKFDELLKAETAFEKRSKAKNPLDGVLQKIRVLFRHKNTDGLLNLIDGLDRFSRNEQAALEHFHIARAYCSVLMDEYQSALSEFEFIDIETLHDAELKQLAAIAIKLQMADLAESIFEMLCHRNIVFYPSYAQLLKLNGKFKAAIEVYSHYLSINKEDVLTWLSLSATFEQTQDIESAKLAYQQVLTIDPDNKTALEKLKKIG